MKKVDEMYGNIKLRSESVGFRTALLALATWVLYEMWDGLSNGGNNSVASQLPSLVLIIVIVVQRISETSMQRKMIAGDDEYKEPNKLLRGIILSIVIMAIVLSVGTCLASMIN